MKQNLTTKTALEHPNKTRTYYTGQINSISATYKSHRIPVPVEIQELADEIRSLITFFNFSYFDCNAIIYQKFGEGVGVQNFQYHFLDPKHGVGFNPRPKTLQKYLHLKNILKKMKKELALISKYGMVEMLQLPDKPMEDAATIQSDSQPHSTVTKKQRTFSPLTEEELSNPKTKVIELKQRRRFNPKRKSVN